MLHQHLKEGSSLTGFNTESSDIDLHVIFDNDNLSRMVRGKSLIEINGTKIKIEYTYFCNFIKESSLANTIDPFPNIDKAALS